MLARADRLTTGREFSETIRRGRRAGARNLVVHLAAGPVPGLDGSPERTPRDERPRVGFVVSRSVGPAVTRNRVKRRLRHLVRAHLPELPVRSRLVVRALPAAAAASSHELHRDLQRALTRVRPQPRTAAPPREPGGAPGGVDA